MNSFIVRFQHAIDLLYLSLLLSGFDVMLLKNTFVLCLNDEYTDFLGWIPLNGLSNATPGLSNNNNYMYLIVKATGNDIWMNTYNGSWLGWQPLPGGLTNVGPAAMTYDDKMMVMVKDLNYGLWINIYEGGAWKSWTPIDGLTDAQPELTSTG